MGDVLGTRPFAEVEELDYELARGEGADLGQGRLCATRDVTEVLTAMRINLRDA